MVGVLGPEVRNEYEGSFLAIFSKIWSSVVKRIVWKESAVRKSTEMIRPYTSPKASIPPNMPPQALAISPLKMGVSSKNITMSLTPRYEWIRDLL